jgi:hypothetical protein
VQIERETLLGGVVETLARTVSLVVRESVWEDLKVLYDLPHLFYLLHLRSPSE